MIGHWRRNSSGAFLVFCENEQTCEIAHWIRDGRAAVCFEPALPATFRITWPLLSISL
jgi:hypothetical protein